MRPRPLSWLMAVAIACTAIDATAIEMFTFFGDGSRIGLPSLEVPVEAYPGIPLRSDRVRARRRGLRSGSGSKARLATGDTITLREVPAPAPAAPAAEPPIAPEPE